MRKIIKWLIVIAVSLIIFALLHEVATARRGYKAVGGEAAALFIPFFIWIATSGKNSSHDHQGDHQSDRI